MVAQALGGGGGGGLVPSGELQEGLGQFELREGFPGMGVVVVVMVVHLGLGAVVETRVSTGREGQARGGRDGGS